MFAIHKWRNDVSFERLAVHDDGGCAFATPGGVIEFDVIACATEGSGNFRVRDGLRQARID